MAQKIIKIGKSVGITIPKEILQKLGVSQGDTVELEVDTKRGGVFVKTSGTRFAVDKELMEWTDDFIEKYRPALEELAKK